MEQLESYDDFLEFSVEELKFYLRQKSHTVTGSKRDLAARALASCEKNEKPTKTGDLQKAVSKEFNGILESFGLDDPLKH